MSKPQVESLGRYELEQHALWFYEECSKFVAQERRVKRQWLQDSLETDAGDLNNVRLVN
jgi:hypothetical protein